MKSAPSQTLQPEIKNAIDAVARSINARQTVIFCGAGISRDSGLPVVNDVVPYVLLTLCTSLDEILSIWASLAAIANAKQRRHKLQQIIAKKMEVLPKVIDNIANSLPFEAFMETLRDNSRIDKMFEIYDVEAYEPHVEPNTNHVMLAKLIGTRKVRTIVTTNFDRLIEKALEQQGKIVGLDYDVIYREEDFEHIDWPQDRCRLIKIHGSIDDKQGMAITLSQVARQELSMARAAIIRKVFGPGDHQEVLILGYSCSDVFDLSPQIEALEDNLKKVCLVQHSDSPRIENIRKQEQKNPFKAFGNSTRLFLNTRYLVEAVWKATVEEPYHYHAAVNTLDWNAKVQAWYVECVHTHSEGIKDVISGRIFDTVCEWQAAIDRYERTLAYATKYADDKSKGLAVGNMGNALRNLGGYRKAIGLYEQAFEIADQTGDLQGKSSALNNMGLAYADLGEYRKAIGLYEQAVEVANQIGDLQVKGSALDNIGLAYADLGEYRKAIGFYKQHLEITRQIGDVRGEGSALNNLGLVYSHLGQYRRAIGLYEQYLEMARQIGDPRGQGRALNNMGNALRYLGKYRKAIGLFEQHLRITHRIGDVQGEGNALGNMGLAYADLGEYGKTLGLYKKYLKTAHRIGDARGEANALNNMGIAFSSLGEYDKAIGLYERALEIDRRIEHIQGEGSALGNMGLAYAHLGEYDKAIGLYERALEIDRRIGDEQGQGCDLNNMALAYSNLGEYRKAIGLFEQVLEIGRRIGDIRGEGGALSNMGLAYSSLGEYRKAIGLFEQVLKIDRRTGNKQGEGNDLGNMGNAYASMGDKEGAAQALAQSRVIFAKLGLPHMVNKVDEIMKQVGP